MTKVLDAIGDVFLSVLSFFVNLSVSRYDDPEIAEYKRRQIACLTWTSALAVVLLVGIFVASQLNTLAERSTIAAVFDGLRAPVAYAFLAASLGVSAFAFHSYYALWRFAKDHGAFDK